MRFMAPLLDVILGMLLAFVSIAAVSGGTDQAEPPEADTAELREERTLSLVVRRPDAPLELTVAGDEAVAVTPLASLDDLPTDTYDAAEVRVTDARVHELLRRLESRGLAARLVIEKGSDTP
jgi:biopolymer transport protein ExbD